MPPPDDSGFYRYGGTFHDIVAAAVNDIIENGYDSAERVAQWVAKIKEAALRTLTPAHVLQDTLNKTMRAIYQSKIERGGILRYHPGVDRFTLARVAPRLRSELDRRIVASVGLIKLNREKMVNETVQRLAGWMTSVPVGGTDVAMRSAVKAEVKKPFQQLPFLERRVIIDQGHKLAANLNNILAEDGGAIALVWRSHFRQRNYNFRESHKERDGRVYLLRGNWAQEAGYVRAGDAGYYDEVTAVGEEVYCRCYAVYVYSLKALPADMLTDRGRAEMAKMRMAA